METRVVITSKAVLLLASLMFIAGIAPGMVVAEVQFQTQTQQLATVFPRVKVGTVKIAMFKEQRDSGFLRKPLESSGKLEFHAPDKLVKHIYKPDAVSQVIEGDTLAIYQGGKLRKTLTLSSEPELALAINTMRWLLAGELEHLEKTFKIDFNRYQASWILKLSPRSPKLAQRINIIEVQGSDNLIINFTMKQANGDSLETRLYGHE